MTTPSEPPSPGPGTAPDEPGPPASDGPVPPHAPAEPVRLHPLSPVYAVVNSARQLLASGVVAAGVGGLRLVLALLTVQLGFHVVGWWRRTYAFDGEVLRVESGVVSRSQQLVPARRVQQVNLVQKLRHRILGLTELRVETAGGGSGSGVVLEVVTDDEAHRLRDALLAAKVRARGAPVAPEPAAGAGPEDGDGDGDAAPAAPAWVPTPWPVVELRLRQLVVAGLTGGELLVVFAVIGSLLSFTDAVPAFVAEQVDGLEADLGTATAVALAALVFVPLWLGSAAMASVLRDGGYVLSLVGDELHVRRGLLDRKEGVLPLARVQAVRITASPLRRWLGLVSVRFQSAGRGTAAEESRVDIPILPERELERVLSLALPGAVPLPTLRSPPRVAMRRAVVRRVVPVAVVVAPLGVLVRPVGTVVAVVAVALCVPWGIAAYRALGHAVGDGFLHARSGALLRRTVVVPTGRAQSGAVRRSPFQRRLGIATFAVHLAGPGDDPRVLDEAETVAEGLLARVTADVGSSPRADSGPARARR